MQELVDITKLPLHTRRVCISREITQMLLGRSDGFCKSVRLVDLNHEDYIKLPPVVIHDSEYADSLLKWAFKSAEGFLGVRENGIVKLQILVK